MSESGGIPGPRPRSEAGRPSGDFDRELDLRGIWGFAAAVAATTVLLHLIVWGLMVGFRKAAVRRDPAPSPLSEANERRLPPAPRLQDDPARDMVTMRAEEETRLTTYGWVDRASGVGRIPIDRAIDLILERGLPETKTPDEERVMERGGAGGPSAPAAGPGRRKGRGP